MGFRSTFITEDIALKVPDWFMDKYYKYVNFPSTIQWGGSTIPSEFFMPMSSKQEAKLYMTFQELVVDMQKIIQEQDRINKLLVVFLHDCGGITRVRITKDDIIYMEPIAWREVPEFTHYEGDKCGEEMKALKII